MTVRSVLFVCVKNGGKSQMAAGLMRQAVRDHAGVDIAVDSAGTSPGEGLNALSAQVLREIGIDISHQRPKAATDELLRAADLVVVLGREATLRSVDGVEVVVWETDEPSERGIGGIERMRLVRDDIAARTDALMATLSDARSMAREP